MGKSAVIENNTVVYMKAAAEKSTVRNMSSVTAQLTSQKIAACNIHNQTTPHFVEVINNAADNARNNTANYINGVGLKP